MSKFSKILTISTSAIVLLVAATGSSSANSLIENELYGEITGDSYIEQNVEESGEVSLSVGTVESLNAGTVTGNAAFGTIQGMVRQFATDNGKARFAVGSFRGTAMEGNVAEGVFEGEADQMAVHGGIAAINIGSQDGLALMNNQTRGEVGGGGYLRQEVIGEAIGEINVGSIIGMKASGNSAYGVIHDTTVEQFSDGPGSRALLNVGSLRGDNLLDNVAEGTLTNAEVVQVASNGGYVALNVGSINASSNYAGFGNGGDGMATGNRTYGDVSGTIRQHAKGPAIASINVGSIVSRMDK